MSGEQDIRAEAQGASSPLDRAAAAYQFGVFPGDESEASEPEIREMARRVLAASGYPSAVAAAIGDLEGARWQLESGPVAIPNVEDALDAIESVLTALQRLV